MISIEKDSISLIDSSIPHLPKGLCALGGAQLPNGDLVLCGGGSSSGQNNEYLHYNHDSRYWKKVGTMKTARFYHSSLWIEDCLLTVGGFDSSRKITSWHEEFSFDGGIKERTEMPIALTDHTATIIDQNRILVCGGHDGRVSNIF